MKLRIPSLHRSSSWFSNALLASIVVSVLVVCLLFARYTNRLNHLSQELDSAFSQYQTANTHLQSLSSQRLFLMVRSAGMLLYANEQNDIHLVSLAAEWQRISKHFPLSGDFYYIDAQGGVPLALQLEKKQYQLNWNASISPLINDFFKRKKWAHEGEVLFSVIYDPDKKENIYLLYSPVFDKWSQLIAWMVNEYNQQDINQAVIFIGRPALVEKAVLLNDKNLSVQGSQSALTQQRLQQLGLDSYQNLSEYGAQTAEHGSRHYLQGQGWLLTTVLNDYHTRNSNAAVAVLFYSYQDLWHAQSDWLSMLGVGYLMSLLACFAFARLHHMLQGQRSVIELANTLQQAAYEGEFSQFITDADGVLVNINHFHAELCGASVADMQGQPFSHWAKSEPAFHLILEKAKHEGVWLGEVAFDIDGKCVVQQMTVRPVYQHQVLAYYVCSGIDISDQKRLASELELLANTDPLTGAANRRAIEQQIKLEVSRYKRKASNFSLILLDIDFFKKVNDEYGHDVGDTCLIHLVKLINALKRDVDVLSRWGGEEFLIFLPNTDADAAGNLVQRIRLELANSDVRPLFTCSAGISDYSNAVSFDELFKGVDMALYQAKDEGRDCMRYWPKP